MTNPLMMAANRPPRDELTDDEALLVGALLNGAKDGLAEICGACRVAVLVIVSEDSPPLLIDPWSLLETRASDLRRFLEDRDRAFLETARSLSESKGIAEPTPPDIDGAFSYCCQSERPFYQLWFSEKPPGIIESKAPCFFLRHAALDLAGSCSPGGWATRDFDFRARTLPQELRRWSIPAVEGAIRERFNNEKMLEPAGIYSILSAIERLSTALEEGRLVHGGLVVVSKEQVGQVRWSARFSTTGGSVPSLQSTKHIRKLLHGSSFEPPSGVADRRHYLVSDGESVLGLSKGELPQPCLCVHFRSGRADLLVGAELIARCDRGRFTIRDRMKVHEALECVPGPPRLTKDLISNLDRVVEQCVESSHGCMIVVDPEPRELDYASHWLCPRLLLEQDNLDLVARLAQIDGAVIVDFKGQVYGFGSLLEGQLIGSEDLSRGARLNSALRFSFQLSRQGCIIIVVSEDGPISLVWRGESFPKLPKIPDMDPGYSAQILTLERDGQES